MARGGEGARGGAAETGVSPHFGGLGVKADGIRERGVEGSPINQSAPCYLWASLEGMNRFLWGGPFDGLSRDFGRRVVRQWNGLAFERGPANAAVPTVATRRIDRIAHDADATHVIEAAVAEASERARATGVHSTALAIDTSAWELVQFALWADRAPRDETTCEVLHLSSPHFDDLEVAPWQPAPSSATSRPATSASPTRTTTSSSTRRCSPARRSTIATRPPPT